MNGEVDCGALPAAGIVTLGDQMRVLGVFNDDNRLGRYTKDAPAVNAVFGTRIPALYSSRAWAIHTEAIEKFPDRFALLERTAKQVFDDPAYKDAYAKTGAPIEAIQYGDRDVCTRYARGMVELANEYRSLLSAKKSKALMAAPNGPSGSKAPLGADLVIPALALGFAVYFFFSIADLAWEAKANGVLIGTVLVSLIAIQLVRVGVQLAKGEGEPRLRAPLGAARGAAQAAWPSC